MVLGDKTNTSGINIGANTVTRCTEHLPDDQKLLVRWLYTYARDQKWDWSELVQQSKLNQSTLWRVWTDKYRTPTHKYVGNGSNRQKVPIPNGGERVSLAGVCEKVARLKGLIEEREAVIRTEFIETSVWDRVEWTCRRAFIRRKIGFIYGESQIGKTTCLKEYMRRNNHGQTRYVEMPPASGVQLMLKCIARALNVSPNTAFDNLLQDVIDALDDKMCLLVDEVHRVFTTYQKSSVMRCLDVLRHIHDQTKCGLVLCGTNVFKDQLQEGEFKKYLKQLQRRGLYETQLPEAPPREDLDLVSAHFGLPSATGEAEELLEELANKEGFGVVITRLTDASELAANKKQKLAWEHFIKAHNIVSKMKLLPAKRKDESK
jgi:DNA transposition AAA+ family ATPase